MLEINNLTKRRINKKRLNKIAFNFLKKYKFPPDKKVSLAIIGDKKMKAINFAYRGQNKTTDVLTFVDLNEILLSFDQIKCQAKDSGRSVRGELEFIFVHGLLHLAGFDDKNEKDRLKMISEGEDFLQSII